MREAQLLAQLASLGVVPVAFQAVVLDRAGDADPVAGNSQIDEPAGVVGILGRHGIDAIAGSVPSGPRSLR